MAMRQQLKVRCMKELHEVLLRYDADLSYTTDDDGIHLSTSDEELAIFFDRQQLASQVQFNEDRLNKARSNERLPAINEDEAFALYDAVSDFRRDHPEPETPVTYYVSNAGGKNQCCVREVATDDIVALCRSNGLASQIADRMNRGDIVELVK